MRKSMILALGASLAVAGALPMTSANALDVSASVGGVSADVSAGSGGVSADVSAGGNSGVNASADVGGQSGGGLGANANASVGSGINADVNAGVGTNRSLADVNATATVGGQRGVQADVNTRIGAETALGVSIGVGGTAANPGGPGGPGVSPVPVSEYFASRNATEQARMQRTCRMVLSDQQAYEKDLADLCRIISRL